MMAVRSRMSATVMRVARSWLAAVCVKILFLWCSSSDFQGRLPRDVNRECAALAYSRVPDLKRRDRKSVV